MELIGRTEEKRLLKKRLLSKHPEFIALYGRRRVGKTSLIRFAIEDASLDSLDITGLKDGTIHNQLEVFTRAFMKTFETSFKISPPGGWMEAFEMVTIAVNQRSSKRPFVIFLDELPWLATPKSQLLQALDHFWNTEWVNHPNVKLIVCGSAASWMIDHIVTATGGLHNRLTASILLQPFTIEESSAFLKSRKVKLNQKQILDLYLVMGGIPFYLQGIERGRSAEQTINQLCFTPTGLLFGEFEKLYSALFKNSDAYIEIIRAIAAHREGVGLGLLETKLKQSSSGGTLTKRLRDLEAAGFIMSFIPYGKEKKGIYYKVIDEYTLFYIHWIEPVRHRIKFGSSKSHHWQTKSQSQKWKSWVGYAFEAFCYKHIEQIAKNLKIHTGYEVGTWRYLPKDKNEKGVQIDLLIDRDDGVIDIIEVKYSEKPYRVTKQYANQLGEKIDTFQEKLSIKKEIFLTLITLVGLLPNEYADELVSHELTLEDFS